MKKCPKRTAAVRPCKAVKRMMSEADKEHIIWISLNSLLQIYNLQIKKLKWGGQVNPFSLFSFPKV